MSAQPLADTIVLTDRLAPGTKFLIRADDEARPTQWTGDPNNDLEIGLRVHELNCLTLEHCHLS
jgi:hypothetical protein